MTWRRIILDLALVIVVWTLVLWLARAAGAHGRGALTSSDAGPRAHRGRDRGRRRVYVVRRLAHH